LYWRHSAATDAWRHRWPCYTTTSRHATSKRFVDIRLTHAHHACTARTRAGRRNATRASRVMDAALWTGEDVWDTRVDDSTTSLFREHRTGARDALLLTATTLYGRSKAVPLTTHSLRRLEPYHGDSTHYHRRGRRPSTALNTPPHTPLHARATTHPPSAAPHCAHHAYYTCAYLACGGTTPPPSASACRAAAPSPYPFLLPPPHAHCLHYGTPAPCPLPYLSHYALLLFPLPCERTGRREHGLLCGRRGRFFGLACWHLAAARSSVRAAAPLQQAWPRMLRAFSPCDCQSNTLTPRRHLQWVAPLHYFRTTALTRKTRTPGWNAYQ